MAALPPLGGSPPQLAGPKKGRSKSEDPSTAAMQAQRDAAKQIEAAGASVDDARRDADSRIDQIRDYYDGRSEEEYAREEAAFEKQRLSGYERLKELKRTQEAEMSRTRRDSERDLDKMNNYYRDTTYATQRSGDQRLQDIEKEQGRSYEHAVLTNKQDTEEEHKQFDGQISELRAADEDKINKLVDTSRERYDKLREDTTEANTKAAQSFEQKYQARLKDTDQTIIDLEARASEGIRDIRRGTSDRLAAYSSRQSDPFYRMLDMNAKIEDDGDSFVLTATIPVHEQKHVSVAVKGNELVLSGARRSEEKLDIAPGRSQNTNAYQSFQETFPIIWPVNASKMTRTFDGDQLTVRIPKKAEHLGYESKAESKIPVPRARLERPKFPENLPHVSENPYEDGVDTVSPDRKTKGSGTLS